MEDVCHAFARDGRVVWITGGLFNPQLKPWIGHHSTSDDSSAYRSVDEVRSWDQKDHPISRFRKYLVRRDLWDDDKEADWKNETKKQKRFGSHNERNTAQR
ncbi:hypothetical protein IscW_ISCW018613 [Ixodes scapularis]|uniref:2-oxoisovalerate dehydrogenase subunit alpha n=1 Tax=Ixodes scapularis TaxID=6945 RepID=B7PL02_IXOSC|nr:hypothetical protein IscW_ISCW018613 [Ixodes scapularis]|eukprot:XP_002434450.1 hypothetical protein IscW_ISCW018613 [Ixodes scapularis]